MPRSILHLAVLAAACVLTFWNTLHNGFHFDDVYRVTNNVGAQELWPPWRHFVDPYTSASGIGLVQYRPLLPLSLSIGFALSGPSVVGYHVGNLLLHFFASAGVYLFARELLTHWSKREYSPHAPLLIALMFAVHPVGGIPVNYICSRDLSMMLGFLMYSLWSYARMRRRGPTTARWAGCLSLLLLALLAKKNAVVAPGLVLLFELLPAGRSIRDVEVWKRLSMFAAIIVLLLLYVRFGLGFSDVGNVVADTRSPEYLANQAQFHVFHYLRNFVWPFPMRFAPDDRPNRWLELAGMTIIIGSWILAWRWRRHRPLLAFSILSYQVFLALTSSVVPLHAPIVPYRPYPSSVFFHLGIALLVLRSRFGTFVLAALILYFGAASFVLNQTWRTGTSLWQHSVDYGGTELAYTSLAENLPDGPEAEAAFRKALELRPTHALADMGLAMLQIRTGRTTLGLQRLRRGIENKPNNALVRNNYARGLKEAGKLVAAAREASKASDLEPDNLDYRCQAGQFLVEAGLYRDCLLRLEPLLRARPSYKLTRWCAGVALFNLHRLPESIRVLELYVADYPENDQALFNLGMALGDAGDFPGAAKRFEQSLVVNPDLRGSHKFLAQIYDKLGDHAAANRHLQMYRAR